MHNNDGIKCGITECTYYAALDFFKITGWFVYPKAKKIEIYLDNVLLGYAKLNIKRDDVYRKYSEYNNEMPGFIYTKCGYAVSPLSKIQINAYDCDSNIFFKKNIQLKLVDEIPNEYGSNNSNFKINNIVIDKNDEKLFYKSQKDIQFKSKLKKINIEPSSLCNIKCKYCMVNTNYGKIERGIISDSILTKSLYSINSINTIDDVQLNALGEPLTNPQFVNICKRIYKETKIRRVHFFTNGMLFTKDVSDMLQEIPLDFGITFSIDGKSIAENNYYRKGSDYHTIKRNIDYLVHITDGKKNFDLQIFNLILDSDNVTIKTPEFLLNDFGFLKIHTHRAFYFTDMNKNILSRLNKEQLDKKIKMNGTKRKMICKRVFSELTIRFNGDVIRCHWDPQCSQLMGNIEQEDLISIWHGKKYIAARKTMNPNMPFMFLHSSCKACHAMNNGYLALEDD
ncbi:MAG: radical SAM/SPASM domain-containing protein [Deltaproteobacteria bacterium]|jgi:radical SAM protein with 4Fe4S-binding SPASM domain|nr:radical SAM/SPASM domain-containing protein [Deltaproteobacteria bacterium]